MDLSIKKDYRSTGKYFHKIPTCNASKCKLIASMDISKECKTGYYSINYIQFESIIMKMSKYKELLIQIP